MCVALTALIVIAPLISGCRKSVENATLNEPFPEISRNELAAHSVPWQAALFYGDSAHFRCGAVLVSDKYALTAAHCVNNIDSRDE